MKKITIAGLIALFLIALTGVYAHDKAKKNKEQFTVHADGSVTVGKHKFNSLLDYQYSDYFVNRGKRCIVKRLKPEERQKLFKSQGDCTNSKTVIKSEYWPEKTYVIPIVFHVISKSSGVGNVTDQQIADQIKVLNEDYGALAGTKGSSGFNTKIQFQLAGITRTVNDDWHDDKNELTYKAALGWDQNRYMNIYVNSADGYLGYAYYPQDAAGTVRDGIVLLYGTVGGRDNGYGQYNQGRTLVHEAGHYFGLAHTFEGGCGDGYEAGDLISDTNPEAVDHYSCIQTHTCGSADPIHNYMNYTPDTCMTEFTAEQGNRMMCCLMNYRPMLASSLYPPANVKFEALKNNLVFREEKINRITWDVNPANNGQIVKYVIYRKSSDDSQFTKLTEITGANLIFDDRDIGTDSYSYQLRGVDGNGNESAPVVVGE